MNERTRLVREYAAALSTPADPTPLLAALRRKYGQTDTDLHNLHADILREFRSTLR